MAILFLTLLFGGAGALFAFAGFFETYFEFVEYTRPYFEAELDAMLEAAYKDSEELQQSAPVILKPMVECVLTGNPTIYDFDSLKPILELKFTKENIMIGTEDDQKVVNVMLEIENLGSIARADSFYYDLMWEGGKERTYQLMDILDKVRRKYQVFF